MLLVFLIALLLPQTTHSDTHIEATEPPKELTIEETIAKYSQIYGAPERLLYSMAMCESNLNPNIKGDSGLAVGLFQYHDGTWNRMSSYMGETLDKYSWHDQIKLTAWVAANRPDRLREWTSYVAIQKGGTYSFYSKLLKRNFTVHCKMI